MQDEPQAALGFAYKMGVGGWSGILKIDRQSFIAIGILGQHGSEFPSMGSITGIREGQRKPRCRPYAKGQYQPMECGSIRRTSKSNRLSGTRVGSLSRQASISHRARLTEATSSAVPFSSIRSLPRSPSISIPEWPPTGCRWRDQFYKRRCLHAPLGHADSRARRHTFGGD